MTVVVVTVGISTCEGSAAEAGGITADEAGGFVETVIVVVVEADGEEEEGGEEEGDDDKEDGQEGEDSSRSMWLCSPRQSNRRLESEWSTGM